MGLAGIADATETIGSTFVTPTRFDGIDSMNAAASGTRIAGTSGNDYFNLAAIGDGVDDISSDFSVFLLNIGDDTMITGNSLNPTTLSNATYGNAVIIVTGSGNDFVDASGETNTAVALLGQAGNDTLIGGAQADILIGGTGADKFGYQTLTDSLLANYYKITDFKVSDADKLLVNSVPTTLFAVSTSLTNLDETAIANALNGNFAANDAATFTFGSQTFIAINDNTAGFSATTDAIIDVTGYTGALSTSIFTTV